MKHAFPIWFLFLVALVAPATAQSLDLTRARVTGGGGTSAGGQFTLFSTVAQPESAARLAGGAFTLNSGFLGATLPSPTPTVFFPSGTVTVLEDAGAQTRLSYATFEPGDAGPPAQPATYQLSNNNPGLFSAAPAIATDRTLTFTPVANASGTATLTVIVRADGVDVATNTFAIVVTPVNDAPTATLAGNRTVLEDAGAQSVSSFATFTAGQSDESAQAPTHTLTADNPALFSSGPAIAANGTLTFTPAANANGSTTITVVTSDGGGTENGGLDRCTNTFTITVTAVNDSPSVTFAQATATVLEDAGAQSLAGFSTFASGPANESAQTLVAYTVSHNNSALFSSAPALAANGTLTFTPAANANGSATVTVVAQDNGGTTDSGVDRTTNTFTITVTAVNDAPSLAFSANPVALALDAGPQTITSFAAFIAGPADEASQTPTYTVTTDNAAMFSSAPTIAPNGTLTFTAANGVGGAATVTVVVQDTGGIANGGVDKATNRFALTVLAFAGVADSFTVAEDATLTRAAGAGVLANDIGPSLRAVLVATTTNGALTLNLDGSFNYQPATHFFGTDHFTYLATNSADTSAVMVVTLTVTPVNDAPSVTFAQSTVTVLEDAGAQTSNGFATFSPGPASESAQTLVGYTVSNSSNALFSVQPAINNAGVLTFASASNANGTALVTVIVEDSGGTSGSGVDKATNTFTIVLAAVNDAPSVTLSGNLTVLEDAGPQTRSGFVTSFSSGPANESAQTPTHAVANDNASLFGVAPAIAANGTLSFTPAPNANGTATVVVITSDGGGTTDGGVDRTTNSFTITVSPVNDPPTVTLAQGTVTVLEDAGPQTRSAFATFSSGPANESAQTLVGYTLSVDNAALFSAAPAFNNVGVLAFTPATNANGSATVTVIAQDSAGTADGGVDKTTNTFTILVTAVNDAPVANPDSFTVSQGDVLTVAAAGVLANDTDVENSVLTATKFTDPVHGTVAFNATGGFTYTPSTSFFGVDSFTYRANDGTDSSAPATVTLNVLARPVITPPPGKQRVFSSAALRFSATNAPDINAIRVSDPDSTTLTLTLTVTNGTLGIAVTNGLAFPNGFANTNTLVLTGFIANLNDALESLAYVSATNYFGDDTLVLVAQDEGGRTNRGNGEFEIQVVIPARGPSLDVSLDNFNKPGMGRTVTNATAVTLDTNLVQGVTYDPTNNIVRVQPTGGQDGSTNRSTVTVLARYSDGTTELITVPVIIYNPLLTTTTNNTAYDATFTTPLFNRQTSLYEQKVRVQNNTPFDFTALRITATNLPATVTLQNATLTNGGLPYIEYNLAVVAGSNVTLKLEYFSSDLRTFTPGLKLELLNQQRTTTTPTDVTMNALAARSGFSPDGATKNYLKFPTQPGRLYYVQYQDVAGSIWKSSPVVLRGTGFVLNWMDDGPPNTDTPPGPVRFYRVVTER